MNAPAPGDQDARTLAKRLEGFVDPQLRVGYCRRWIRDHEPARVAEMVMLAAHRAEARDASQGNLLLALCLALAEEEELRRAVIDAALETGRTHAAAILYPRPAVQRIEASPNVPDFGRGRPLSLGERKSLARGRDRDLLARVLRDPHPQVVRILLGNPALVERDVVRLCATRPLSEEVPRAVFRSPRWIIRYPVRRALVNNPFTPVDIALQLAPALTRQDAREVLRSQDLADELREVCSRICGASTRH